jgi:outer membrane protein
LRFDIHCDGKERPLCCPAQRRTQAQTATESLHLMIRVSTYGRLAALALAAPLAWPALPTFFQLGVRPDQRMLTAGVLVTDQARYDGAAERRTEYLPDIGLYRTDGWFADTINGLGYNASTDKAWEYGMRALPDLGRDESSALRGLGRIQPTLLASAFANANLSERLQLQSTVNFGAGYGHRGARVDLGAAYAFFVEGPFQIGVDASIGLADRHYAQSYYGINADQAARTGRPTYQPAAGADQLRADLTFFAPLSEKWISYSSVGRNRLLGDAARGPYVVRKSDRVFVLGLTHLF